MLEGIGQQVSFLQIVQTTFNDNGPMCQDGILVHEFQVDLTVARCWIQVVW
jgi:hypothetical protein